MFIAFLIIIGIPFSILANLIDIPLYLGLAFIMVGLYLFVKDPVIFYVGLIAMAADFVFEKLFMLSNQYGYTVAYGETGVCWFLGAASIAAIFLLLNFNSPESISGWAIPIATDIAFTLGILALLGKKAPLPLK